MYREALRGQALIDALTPASAVVLMRDRAPFHAELIGPPPNPKLVHFTGTRNGALDAKALAARGIQVLHAGWGPNMDATTEMTWALILAAQKRLVRQHEALLRAHGVCMMRCRSCYTVSRLESLDWVKLGGA